FCFVTAFVLSYGVHEGFAEPAEGAADEGQECGDDRWVHKAAPYGWWACLSRLRSILRFLASEKLMRPIQWNRSPVTNSPAMIPSVAMPRLPAVTSHNQPETPMYVVQAMMPNHAANFS